MAAGPCRRPKLLKNLDPLLGPALLQILRSMGHGDEIAIVDANYPAATRTRRLVRLDGVSATDVLRAVLSVLPLDAYVQHPVHTMQVVENAAATPEIVAEFHRLVAAADADAACSTLERFNFYDRVNAAFAVVATGERRLYGNILLTKGVIDSNSLTAT